MAQILFDDYLAAKTAVYNMWDEVFGIKINWNLFATDTQANSRRSENTYDEADKEEHTVPSEVAVFPDERTETNIKPLNQAYRFNEINSAEKNGKITADAVNALYNLMQVAEEEAHSGAGYGADKTTHWQTYNSSKNTSVKTSQYSGYDSYNSNRHSGWCTGRNSSNMGTNW